MTAAGSDDESFVDLTDLYHALGKKTLSLTLTPKNNSIGIHSKASSALICATVKACPLPTDDDHARTPVDIIVALDISSSMLGDKLALCKLTIEQLVRNLLPHDRFGLIKYSDDAVIAVLLQPMSADNKQKVLSTVKNLSAYGSTNMSAAIALSFQELQSVTTPNKVRSIFLLTDGHANIGVTDQVLLTEMTQNCWNDAKQSSQSLSDNVTVEQGDDGKTASNARPSIFGHFQSTEVTKKAALTDVSSSPVSLLCFGYGHDHNAPMLRDVSEATESGS
jgi:von Willebrand factor type A domain